MKIKASKEVVDAIIDDLKNHPEKFKVEGERHLVCDAYAFYIFTSRFDFYSFDSKGFLLPDFDFGIIDRFRIGILVRKLVKHINSGTDRIKHQKFNNTLLESITKCSQK